MAYRVSYQPVAELQAAPAQDHTALAANLGKLFRLPLELDATALDKLRGAAAAAADPEPYLKLIQMIEANGRVWVEQTRMPDLDAGAANPAGLDVRRKQ